MAGRFDPEYVALVLEENFEDAKAQFLSPLMRIHYAHLVMLVERGIVARPIAHAIRTALDAVSEDSVRAVRFDGRSEDLFFHIERVLTERCGDEAAGRLHTARSRNDIDMTMYRMHQRGLILDVVRAVIRLRAVLLTLADAHRDDVFAAETHTQPAQPTTLAHYLLAVVEQLERDLVRLRAAFASTNVSPLGACAITGTAFPIDRHRTSALLGFDAPGGNTYGCIATVDYLLESVSAAGVLLAGLGRVVQHLLLWCTAEYGYLRLGDGFVQCSSIMPQKRNPVALEHARALASKALGQTSAVILSVHNTPFGDIVDTEDDLQPLVSSMFKDATRAVRLVAAAMASATFDRGRLAARADAGWITVTELADTLTRDHDVPFRAGHAIAARFAAECTKRPGESRAAILREVSTSLVGRAVDYDDASIDLVLSARHFVAVRTTLGGPAPAETARAIAASRVRLEEDSAWLTGVEAGLDRAAAMLKEASEGL